MSTENLLKLETEFKNKIALVDSKLAELEIAKKTQLVLKTQSQYITKDFPFDKNFMPKMIKQGRKKKYIKEEKIMRKTLYIPDMGRIFKSKLTTFHIKKALGHELYPYTQDQLISLGVNEKLIQESVA